MKVIAALITFMAISSTDAAEKTVCYKVEGITCSACSVTIRAAAKKVDGVAGVNVDVRQELAQVIFEDQKTTPTQIASAITNSGYKASEVDCPN